VRHRQGQGSVCLCRRALPARATRTHGTTCAVGVSSTMHSLINGVWLSVSWTGRRRTYSICCGVRMWMQARVEPARSACFGGARQGGTDGVGRPRGQSAGLGRQVDAPPRFDQMSDLVSIWLAVSHLWHSSKRRSHAGERRTAAACWTSAAPETCGDRECGRDPASSLLPYTSLKVLGAVPASNLPWSSRAEAGAWLTQGVRYGTVTAGASREHGGPAAIERDLTFPLTPGSRQGQLN
jgi:hypothetical protein